MVSRLRHAHCSQCEPYAVDTDFSFPVQDAGQHLEADSEKLGRQRIGVPHALLDWYAKCASEQRYSGPIRFFNYFDIALFNSFLYES